MLKNISKFSSKYAKSIELVLKAVKEKRKVFIYSELVKGSGGILYSLLLNLFGFSKANGTETTPGLRYSILNNVTTKQQSDIKKIKNRFNQSDNLFGEYISVIIGSAVISEGYSFKDVQEEHILTPFWNYSCIYIQPLRQQ